MIKFNKEIMDGLSEERQYIVTAMKLIYDTGEGVGLAPNSFLEASLTKIMAGEMKDSEWFALEYQSGDIMNKATEIYDRDPSKYK
jgi:hypothetical protein